MSDKEDEEIKAYADKVWTAWEVWLSEHGMSPDITIVNLRTALKNIGNVAEGKKPRWVHVMALFGFGSTSAKKICRNYDTDPDEIVGQDKCETCPLVEEALDGR